jgi:hypothetical protein
MAPRGSERPSGVGNRRLAGGSIAALARLLPELALRVVQGLRLDQQAAHDADPRPEWLSSAGMCEASSPVEFAGPRKIGRINEYDTQILVDFIKRLM